MTERLETVERPAAIAKLGRELSRWFDNSDFSTRSLETAYATIHERYRADLPPRHIFINPE